MSNRWWVIVLMVAVSWTTSLHAQEDRAAYEAKLNANRKAAYQRYRLRPSAIQPPAAPAPPASAGPPGPAPFFVQTQPLFTSPVPGYLLRQGPSAAYSGDLRVLFYDIPNSLRGRGTFDYPLSPFIDQPVWDSRYRRSWPRPVVTRQYVPSQWMWTELGYRYVPGHSQTRTQWVVQGWPRYRWNGSHYSVSVSFN